jgi:uncharacterized membrane protein (UPF0182 family)
VRHILRLAIIISLIVLAWTGLSIARNVYTDWLWFDSVGYGDVYQKRIATRTWLFFAGAGVFLLAFVTNALIAYRLSRGPSRIAPEKFAVAHGLLRLAIVLAGIILIVTFGATTSSQWDHVLGFANVSPFTDVNGQAIADPMWGHNPTFYIFNQPLFRFVQIWLLGLMLVLFVQALAIYVVSTATKGFLQAVNRKTKTHLAAILALFFAAIAWSFWFDISELPLNSGGLKGTLFGASATDATARLFALRFMMAASLALGIAFIAAAWWHKGRFAIFGFAGWMACAAILLILYPAAYQRFSVSPSELARETPYIERNIAMTREAYQLNRIESQAFPVEGNLSPADVFGSPGTITNIRLWDYRPLLDTYNQIQSLRPYYVFSDVDIDRYTVNGRELQVMLSARELSSDLLPEEAHTWVAKHLQYTHGYGVAMSPVTEFTAEGRPTFLIQNVPPKGALAITQPQIYYGELTRTHVLVNSKTQEFDYPTAQDSPVYTTFEGSGGVHLSSFARKAALAWRLGDFNLLISNERTAQTRVLYNRHIQDRITKIAPFLRLDGDPYIVAADGKLYWMQDAYTTTNRFPYSQRYRGSFNYVRNSVKIVTSAYDGSLDFYVSDPSDALVRTYASAFPSLFKPMTEMPASLRAHIRYPEGLFDVQEELYRTYHSTDPRVFFTKEDVWGKPSEIFYNDLQPIEAYYVIMPLPGQQKEEFLLFVPFTAQNKPNMVAWLAARNDGEHYGKLAAYTFPKDKQIDGPAQVEARINNDPIISQQFALWNQQGSQVIRGNLLVIPLGKSLLYIEPVYLQASTLRFPELKRVIVVNGSNAPIMEPTLERALQVAFGLAPPSTIPGPGVTQPGTGGQTQPAPNIDELIKQVEQLLEQLKRLREQGK